MKRFWHLIPCATLALLPFLFGGCTSTAVASDATKDGKVAAPPAAPQSTGGHDHDHDHDHEPAAPEDSGQTGTTTRPDQADGGSPDASKEDVAKEPGFDYLEKVPPENPQRAKQLAGYVRKFESTNENNRTIAIQDMLAMNDPVVIPYLLPQLDKEGEFEDKLRVRVTMGILRTFPDHAVAVFEQLLERGTVLQKQSAAHAVGRLAPPRMPEMLLPYVTHEDERLRRAAISGASTVGTYVQNYYTNFALQKAAKNPPPIPAPPADLIGRVDHLVETLMQMVLSQDLNLMEEPFMILRRYGNHARAVQLMDHYVSQVPEEDQELAAFLKRMQHVNRRWLGRPARMPAELVEYEFWMMNLKSDKSKEFIIMFDADTLDWVRGNNTPLNLDRGTTLQLAADELMLYPQICTPSIEEDGEETLSIRYRVPLVSEVRAGIGTANIGYWNSNTNDAEESVMVVDKVRGVPLSEEVFDSQGETIAEVIYGDYVDVGDGALVPGKINLTITQFRKSGQRQMRYEFHYKTESGIWLFDEGTALQVDQETGELVERALGETRAVSIIEESAGPIGE